MTVIGRIVGPEVYGNLLDLVTIRIDALPWSATDVPGVAEKVFERIPAGPDARETAVLRLAPGTDLGRWQADCRVDLFVLAGSARINGQACGARHYVRIPAGDDLSLNAPGGATFLVKQRAVAGGEAISLDTGNRANWAAWGGRGSEKAQIYDPGVLSEAAWVGFMLPDLTIPEHAHAGGEEIFILEGELSDERGRYGPGTWVRFPVGLTHTPTSSAAGCMMLVREGDACPAA